MKALTQVRRRGRVRVPKFWNWISKIIPDLWLLELFCPIKKKFPHSTLIRIHFFTDSSQNPDTDKDLFVATIFDVNTFNVR